MNADLIARIDALSTHHAAVPGAKAQALEAVFAVHAISNDE